MDILDSDLRHLQSLCKTVMVSHSTTDYVSSERSFVIYYQQSAQYTGGMNQTADFHGVFFVPGMTHCQLASNTAWQTIIPLPSPLELIGKLVAWVEDRKAPVYLMAQETISAR